DRLHLGALEPRLGAVADAFDEALVAIAVRGGNDAGLEEKIEVVAAVRVDVERKPRAHGARSSDAVHSRDEPAELRRFLFADLVAKAASRPRKDRIVNPEIGDVTERAPFVEHERRHDRDFARGEIEQERVLLEDL